MDDIKLRTYSCHRTTEKMQVVALTAMARIRSLDQAWQFVTQMAPFHYHLRTDETVEQVAVACRTARFKLEREGYPDMELYKGDVVTLYVTGLNGIHKGAVVVVVGERKCQRVANKTNPNMVVTTSFDVHCNIVMYHPKALGQEIKWLIGITTDVISDQIIGYHSMITRPQDLATVESLGFSIYYGPDGVGMPCMPPPLEPIDPPNPSDMF